MFADIRKFQSLVCETDYDADTAAGNVFCSVTRDNTVSSVINPPTHRCVGVLQSHNPEPVPVLADRVAQFHGFLHGNL